VLIVWSACSVCDLGQLVATVQAMAQARKRSLSGWRPSQISAEYSHPDPDFLMTLFEPSMDFTASRTEFTFWCMWSSPLLIDTDLRNLTHEKRSIITNAEAIAVNQDTSK
jgi:hypothetical protein